MRVLPRVAGVLVLLLAGFTFTPVGPVQAQSAHGPHFWLVLTGPETFTQAVRQAAREPGGAEVVPTLEAMLQRVAAGQMEDVPEPTARGEINVPATVPALRAAIAAAQSLNPGRAARNAVPELSPPQDFPVAGSGCNPYIWNHVDYFASWCDMVAYIEVEECDPGCQILDRVSTKSTANPGSLESLVNFTLTYFPDNHDFTDIHFEWWTLCYRNAQTCGTGKSPNYSGSLSSSFRMSSPNLHNSMITLAFAIEALFIPNGSEYAEGIKTIMGYCLPQSSNTNQCLFPDNSPRHASERAALG